MNVREQRVAVWGLIGMAIMAMLFGGASAPVMAAEGHRVLEDFHAKEADGFPANWQHENGRNEARAREAYKVQGEPNSGFLAVRNADQRIKNKKIEWDPKAQPVLTWRWRLHKAPADADPIAVIYVALDTDLLFIPVFTKYIWSGTKAEGTVTEGGMFSGSEIVVQSGLAPTEWVEERVNVYEDFKRIHKHEPAEKAWGISLFASPGVEVDFGLIAVLAPK
ncbi:MAG: DUF3047 domain-containing protein [Nitrospirota bacterium]|nr:DUF3047 domain-containing protein [Nitrospirota bacterium]